MNIETCHICQSKDISQFNNFSSLYQVTSDCKPWHPGGMLILCNSCQTLQKVSNDKFLYDIEKIYQSYNIYYQGKGNEQRGFDQLTGSSSARTQLIVKWLLNNDILPKKGYMLDIGCGPGKLLDSFSIGYPKWKVSGFEIDDKYQMIIENKHQKNSFYSGSLDTVDRQFNLIALIHTLEHISSPSEVLIKINNKLSKNGYLLIAVPDFTQNPFDLLIADHCTHFSQENLVSLLHKNGFTIIEQLKEKLNKEVVVVAKKATAIPPLPKKLTNKSLTKMVNEQINWLINITEQSGRLGEKEKFGVFGTAIAANWLLGFKKEQIQFFLDEDPDRIDTQIQNKPVYHPNSLKFDHNIPIYLPFPLPIAKNIAQRLKPFHIKCVLPPDMPL